MKNITIRNAGPGDIERIMLIESESFHENIRESRSVFQERIAIFPEGFLILEISGHVCGYISSEVWNYSDKITDSRFSLDHRIRDVHKATGEELYISSIGILKKYRGKGYGNLLFTELYRRMNDRYTLSSMILLVSANWTSARKIYERNGFCEIHRIRGFFNEDEVSEGIVMRKHITHDMQ